MLIMWTSGFTILLFFECVWWIVCTNFTDKAMEFVSANVLNGIILMEIWKRLQAGEYYDINLNSYILYVNNRAA